MVAVPEENIGGVDVNKGEEEVEDDLPEVPKKSFKAKLAEYEAQLREQSETIIRHVRYLCVEFWHDQDCAESWAYETIDMVELYIDLDFQRHAARFIMESMPDMPLLAKKYIRKHFDLWT